MNFEWNESTVQKFEDMFWHRFQEHIVLRDKIGDAEYIADCEERWSGYLFKYGITAMGFGDVKKVLNMPRINQNTICIENPEENDGTEFWFLVPKPFAEKCVILGGLP
jgi:hypothetical protein